MSTLPAPPPTPLLPANFAFGVATAGFQIEGGYNGRDEPANNWAEWERSGRVEASGVAVRFFRDYEHQLDLAAACGLTSFRMSIEWARVEPTQGEFDTAAIERYRAILSACHDRGLEPLVTLHHFTHPAWLGENFWLNAQSPDRYISWVRFAVDTFGDLCHHWVTINEYNILAVNSYLTGIFPPGERTNLTHALFAIDSMVTAHICAYDLIHELQPHAVVATNNYSFSIYELDRLPLDLLVARAHGVEEAGLTKWLSERRRAHYDLVPTGIGPIWGAIEELLRQLASSKIPLASTFPRARAAIYAGSTTCFLDVAQVDYYAPTAAEHLVAPFSQTAGGRLMLPLRPLWDDRPDPTMFSTYCTEAGQLDLPVWVVESGLCNRVKNGRSYPRLDGWTRSRYLAAHIGALCDLFDAGIKVAGYWHWTLVDNYEWGSYEPRFGIYGVDRDRGVVISDSDAMGYDAAAAYRSCIDAVRAGDRRALDALAQ